MPVSSHHDGGVIEHNFNRIVGSGSASYEYGGICTAKCDAPYPVNSTKCYESYDFQQGYVAYSNAASICPKYGEHRPLLKTWQEYLAFRKWNLLEDDRMSIICKLST